ncbi:hypothetical protein GOP47_0002558 [Adiantum capillus-veneris]|uniref:non-specific serine/threonine protein kinase n=1 Tax=Adiantum capillus-veneris TaxID=13818 RepID=A0A9D4VAB3_ADICA|nr:hypothetical protein GOP47_0002558 [Adiantum capillus-veneris]
MATNRKGLLSYRFCICFLLQHCSLSFALTNQQDVIVLKALKQAWSPTISWNLGTDPCQTSWLGIFCDDGNTTIAKLILPAQGISGTLPHEIGSFVNLQILDLSYNRNLTGSLPLQLFRLTNLTELYLQDCGFYGSLPQDLGNFVSLTTLSLNRNFFSGSIPHTIGQLSELVWLDLSSNELSGNLPLSLARLRRARHFHLQGNSFSGVIPAGIFNSKLPLIHLLLHNNSFEGSIPADIGSLKELDIMRLDHNTLTNVSGSLAHIVSLTTLRLDHNNLTGDLPDLSGLINMQVMDLSNNQFSPGPVPSWLWKFTNLSALALEAGNLLGSVPTNLFSLQRLALMRLGYNSLNGTLDLRMAGPSLAELDFQQNNLSGILGSFTGTLNLQGNPVCQTNPNHLDIACLPVSESSPSLPSLSCRCQRGFASNPSAALGSCLCAYPLSGILVFTALKVNLDLRLIPILKDGFVKSTPLLDTEDQIVISILSDVIANISIFPQNAEAWDADQANSIIALLSSKAVLFPGVGPYEYLPFGPYSPPGTADESLSASVQVGIGTGIAAFAAVLVIICGYAVLQKKRAEKAEEISKPFVSWVSMREDKGGPPKLKGARLFALAELKRATHNFNKAHEIGVGGYGKVYKGTLPSGEQIAIKKAQARSHQGAAEFRNEIELLSRVHHKNLVCLVGFCFEERMLVYEYVPNGTLHEALLGNSSVILDWQRRLTIAVGSARGLAYLHNEANPPVIHRDVKSSNILLDQNLVAKVADFGLSRLAPDDEGSGDGHVSTQVKGTLGYLDPEYCTTQRLSDKSDVYSFGVVLLELITSRQPIAQGKHIVREVRSAWQKGGLQAVMPLLDPLLKASPTSELRAFLDVALRCVEEEAVFRPTMKQVGKEIEAIRDAIPHTQAGFSTSKDLAFQYSGGYDIALTIEPK